MNAASIFNLIKNYSTISIRMFEINWTLLLETKILIYNIVIHCEFSQ